MTIKKLLILHNVGSCIECQKTLKNIIMII